ncbi:hypothetical protein MRB53_033240 [Persea americana]|uniref:Uncharacterized protein n=1 Tax=Persea americana TaxID=3435 RepID=A0ACC2KUN6_PERAE|nr:hypothetical protein MRB53_033240 [Persea americana]
MRVDKRNSYTKAGKQGSLGGATSQEFMLLVSSSSKYSPCPFHILGSLLSFSSPFNPLKESTSNVAIGMKLCQIVRL